MLAARATRIVTIASSRIRNSLIFSSSCFLSASFFVRAVSISARISGCACRARISLRTCWTRRSCHWSGCWSSLAPGHKQCERKSAH
jgi:hypothetical protein